MCKRNGCENRLVTGREFCSNSCRQIVLEQKRRESPEWKAKMERARRLYEDGCSTNEVHKTTGIRKETLRREFPNGSWTKEQAREHQAVVLMELRMQNLIQ